MCPLAPLRKTKPEQEIPMTTTVQTQSEYRDLPIDWLIESTTNPRQTFEEDAMQELAASIREHGVLQPLLVRPHGERRFEIVFGARRYRGAAMAEKETVPVCIREMTDAQVLEAQLVENLQRQDVHPLHEAQGFAALLRLEEPKYSIELIAAKCGKQPGYIASRLRLTELAPAAVEAFTKDEIGLGHALLLAKLPSEQQEEALTECWQESYANGSKAKRILLPVRHLREWIERNILLELGTAPFSKEDATLVPEAGSCLDCAKRTGHNTLLFEGIAAQHDSCSDPACYAAKVDAHVKRTVAAKPKLVQITTALGKPAEGSAIVPRGQYVEIRQDKPKNKYQQEAPEYKTCKYVTEAIVADGTEKGELRKVCANPDCPVHHPKKQQRRANPDAATKAAQEKHRSEEAIANTTGIRVLAAIADAVPVRLMKRDLLFVVERLAGLVEERRLEIVARQHGIKREKDSDSIAKLFAAYVRRAEESVLGSLLVELTILLTAARQQTAQVLRDAAAVYKVDTDAIAAKVKQEFAAKDKTKAAKNAEPKTPAKQQAKLAKKSAAA
jgi:ParB family chromosome partitioning protein